jgi:RNA polymerase sigma-70 factor (ECF subfamily)
MIDDDAQLMLRVREGDRAAFDALFRRWAPPVVNFLARMVPDRARAEELAQDVFVRIYGARERYEVRARFSTWLFGIAHNLALNELARAHRKRERPLGDEHLDTLADDAPEPEQQLDTRRTARALEAALPRLPDRQRAALLLRTQENLSYDEIAEALGASTSGIKSLLHRARENLLGLLEEKRK